MIFLVGTFLFALLIMMKFKWFLIIGLILIYFIERGVI